MNRDELFSAISAQRRRLCETLDGLDGAAWNEPSLCSGWRVREVFGHLVSILDVPQWKWAVASVRHRGFNRAADHLAREFAGAEPAALVDRYRSLADGTFTPPVVGPIAPLVDVLVHTRDIERPLGLASTLADDALTEGLAFLSGAKTFGFVRKGLLEGVRLEATDRPWATGSGAVAAGNSEAILMTLAGRTAALDDLTGDATGLLRSRLNR